MKKFITEELLAEYNEGILGVIGSKVTKELGKGLSENDFTNEDKEKLDKIDSIDEAFVNSLFETS